MDGQSDFESEIRERIGRLESAVSALSARMDTVSSAPSPAGARAARPGGGRDASSDPGAAPASASQARPQSPRAVPLKHSVSAEPSRGADWWLARAGAALTVVALILLYQYAVGHGWITPIVRVFTGTAIGAALMYWGRKIEPAAKDAAFPVALRELMMGCALAAWYVSAYAASVLYHLISVPTARGIYLVLSLAGGLIALNERRSLLAIIAIGTGFATPALLYSPAGSIPAYMLFLAVLGGLSVYLYLMRGWQSILWIAFFSMAGSISAALSQTLLAADRVSLTLLILATSYAFLRAPSLRRKLVATGAERYEEPIRSTFAQTWLRNTGDYLKILSPHAGSTDSLSVWIITLLAPLVGIELFTRTWSLGDYAGGGLAILAGAVAAQRFLSNSETDLELNDLFSAAAIVWSLSGVIAIGRSLAHAAAIDDAAFTLGAMAVYSMAIVVFLTPPRFVTALILGRLLAGFAIAAAVFVEVSSLGTTQAGAYRLTAAFSIAEVLSIAAALAAARELSRHSGKREAVAALALTGYAALLLLDARVLGQLWSPLVTATYAIAGTALLLRGRGREDKLMLRAGGATIALVIGRLFFVDLVGVDTIWRVLLFLGCGALFLFTSHQIQNAAKQPPPDVA